MGCRSGAGVRGGLVGGERPPHATARRAATRRRPARPLFWKIDAPWPAPAAKPDHWVAWAIVHDRWKLAANRDLSHTELYDIASDAGESTDVKAANLEAAGDLLGKLKAWQATLPEKPTGEVFSELREGRR